MVNEIYEGGAHHHSLYGDILATNASYNDPSWIGELYKMYHRNEFVQLMVDWMVSEAFRNWIKFIEDTEPIVGLKFGQPYKFQGYEYMDEETGKETIVTPFLEYAQWNDVPAMWKQGVSWSRLYNEGALLVFLDSDDNLLKMAEKKLTNVTITWKANPDPQGYTRFVVFQPLMETAQSTGFRVEEANADGTIKTWKVVLHNQYMKSAKTFLIDAERCIHLLWKKRENGWKACSRVLPMMKYCKMEEQTFQKLSKRAHDIAGGILHIDGIASEAEQTALDLALGADLTANDRIYTQLGRTVEYKTPDLKAAGEFATIFEMYTKKLCRFMRISQLVLDGEHTGASLGGNDNAETMNSYTEIYEIQEHYRNYLEKVFYKLGKKKTSFIYREVLPEEMRAQQDMMEKEFEHENEIARTTAQSDRGTDSRDGKPSTDGSKDSGREQTR